MSAKLLKKTLSSIASLASPQSAEDAPKPTKVSKLLAKKKALKISKQEAKEKAKAVQAAQTKNINTQYFKATSKPQGATAELMKQVCHGDAHCMGLAGAGVLPGILRTTHTPHTPTAPHEAPYPPTCALRPCTLFSVQMLCSFPLLLPTQLLKKTAAHSK